MRDHPFMKLLSFYLVVAVVVLSLPAQGWAMIVPARHDDVARAADVAKVRTALESTAVKQRLVDYGLSPEEASQRLALLSDEQVHQFAAQLDAVQAGGDGLGDVVFVLLVVVLVIVILELTGHQVVMRR